MPRKKGVGGPDDRARYLHMLDAAREARHFLSGKTLCDLEADRLLLRGLVNCIQEIGEAASGVSVENRARAPGVPWGQIVGMRQILVHVYWGIRPDRLWETVHSDLPPLIAELERSLDHWPSAEPADPA